MDESQIREYLRKRFPDYQNLRVSNLTNIAAGWETRIHGFELECNIEDMNTYSEWIIRQYPGKHAAQKALHEADILSGLEKAGYPVPIVRVLEESPIHLGTPFIMMDRIRGHTLAELMGLHPSKHEEQLALFSQLFVELHRLDYTMVIEEQPNISGNDTFYWVKKKIDGYEYVMETFHKTEFSSVLEWLRDGMKFVPCNKPSLTHGDFHPYNILIDDNQHPYVIDWTAWDFTDYRVDLGWTLLLHGAFSGSQFRDETLKGYESVAEIQVDNINYFEVLAGLRRMLDISISFSEGATQMSMREDALETIRESLEHMTYVHDLIEDYTDLEIPKIEYFIEENE